MTAEQRTSEDQLPGKNRFNVAVHTESGCNVKQGEYSVYITGIIAGFIGHDDFYLVAECIAESLDDLSLPEEGWTPVVVQETGEREDVFWHKYYEVDRNV